MSNEYSYWNNPFISSLSYIGSGIRSIFSNILTTNWIAKFNSKGEDEKEVIDLSYTVVDEETQDEEQQEMDIEPEQHTFKTDIPYKCDIGKKRKADVVDPKCEKDYLENVYTAKQLAKLYERVSQSSYLIKQTRQSKENKYAKEKIFQYFSFICDKPKLALCTLLWFDSFHDFKQARLKEKEKYDLNNIIQSLSWLNQLEKKQNVDELYRDSFFDFNYDKVKHILIWKKNIKKAKTTTSIRELYKSLGLSYNTQDTVTDMKKHMEEYIINLQNTIVKGFHYDVKHTVLKPCLELLEREKQIEFANLLYNISDIFLTSFVEADFFHAYMIYNFNFKLKKDNKFDIDGLLKDFQNIAWNQIQEEYIPYWCKDVDEESASFLRGTNVIIPASIFDQNKSNSSKDKGDFINIKETIIPYANGYNFIYNYSENDCGLKVDYGLNQIYTPSSSNCTKITNEDISNIEDILLELSNEIDKTNFLQKISQTEGTSHAAISYAGNLKIITDKLAEITLFDSAPINLKGQSGFSPKLVTIQIIILLCKKFKALNEGLVYPKNSNNGLTCAHFDFWFSLKRIGDYGQILQAKQAGIPLFTNDKMQILISIATCTSSVFSIDGTKAIWYDGVSDSFICNKWAQNYIPNCKITRKSKGYKGLIEIQLGINKIDNINSLLYKASSNINKSNYKKLLNIIDVDSMGLEKCK
jgi:hypothetical protein